MPRKEEVFVDLLSSAEAELAESKRQAILDAWAGIDLVDLNAAMSDPANRDEYFYKTDHHPTPAGARVIYESMVAQLEAQGVELAGEPAEWIRQEAGTPFAGSEIKVIPDNMASPLDDFWWWEPEAGWSARQCVDGTCDGALLSKSWIDDPAWNANKYRAFLGGGFGAIHLHNENAAVDSSVVMLKDSYSHYAAMLLSERVRDLYLVDERGWDGPPLAEFIADVDSDAVIIAHNPVTLLSQAFNLEAWADAGSS